MAESDAMRLETKKGKTNKVPSFCWSYRAALLKLYRGSWLNADSASAGLGWVGSRFCSSVSSQ